MSDFYEGEWKEGKRQGKGVEYEFGTYKYEGSWEDDRKQGEGKFTFQNGKKVKMEFNKGVLNWEKLSVAKLEEA